MKSLRLGRPIISKQWGRASSFLPGSLLTSGDTRTQSSTGHLRSNRLSSENRNLNFGMPSPEPRCLRTLRNSSGGRGWETFLAVWKCPKVLSFIDYCEVTPHKVFHVLDVVWWVQLPLSQYIIIMIIPFLTPKIWHGYFKSFTITSSRTDSRLKMCLSPQWYEICNKGIEGRCCMLCLETRSSCRQSGASSRMYPTVVKKNLLPLKFCVFFFFLSHAKMYLAELGLFWSVLSN